jgi:D-alanyl-D-alanine carboxypeptidase (penicillin-binding protein 5/6)
VLRFFTFFILLFSVSNNASSQDSNFYTEAPHAIIMDVETGEVLFEKGARVGMSPASMTKIMTAHMVFDALKNGVITPDTKYLVSNEAWKRGGVSSGSSTMFLEAGSYVSVMDLLRGIVIQSGNDACIAIAEGMAGNEEFFAKRMTAKAKELGLTTANFKNATGWPHPEHKISAYDLASLTKQSMASHPDYFSIYSEGAFTWNGINQKNRNPLLGKFNGANGVKTGSTKDSGYGLVGSATIGENSRIIVVNGLASKSQRSSVSQKLMQAAFSQFKVYALYKKNDIVGQIDVYLGSKDKVNVMTGNDINVGMYYGDRSSLKTKISYKDAVSPIDKGTHVADLIIAVPGRADRVVPLLSAESINRDSIFGIAWSVLKNKIRGN